MDEMIHRIHSVLVSSNISYVIIGGIAASLLGKPRMTMDSDIVIILSHEKTEPFIEAVKQIGFSITESSKPKIISRLNRGLSVKLRYTKRYSADVRLASYSIDFLAIQNAKKSLLFDRKLSIVQPEELIVYKLARFDAIDQADIQAILVRHKKNLDTDKIISSTKTLAEETGNETILENLSTFLNWSKT